MRRFLTLQLVQRTATKFASLHRGLAVLAQIFTGRNIVVQAEEKLLPTRAHQGIREYEVGHEERSGVVGDCLAGGGAEAESGEN